MIKNDQNPYLEYNLHLNLTVFATLPGRNCALNFSISFIYYTQIDRISTLIHTNCRLCDM